MKKKKTTIVDEFIAVHFYSNTFTPSNVHVECNRYMEPGKNAFCVYRKAYDGEGYALVPHPAHIMAHNTAVQAIAASLVRSVERVGLAPDAEKLVQQQFCSDNDLYAVQNGAELRSAVFARAVAHDKDKASACAGIYSIAGAILRHVDICEWDYLDVGITRDQHERLNAPGWEGRDQDAHVRVFRFNSSAYPKQGWRRAMNEYAAALELHDLRQGHHVAAWVTNSNALHFASMLEHLADGASKQPHGEVDISFHREGALWIRDDLRRWHTERTLTYRMPMVMDKYYALFDALRPAIEARNGISNDMNAAEATEVKHV